MNLANATAEPNAATRGVLRSAQRLLARRGRETAQQFLVEGRQGVREALDVPGLVVQLFVVDPGEHADLIPSGVRVYTTTPEQMRKLSDTVSPQGIVAVCRQQDATVEDIADPRLVVICAQIRDPGNAGTVIRCADAFGADGVFLTTSSVELRNPKTVRASVGSIFHLPVVTGIDLSEAVAWCRSRGMQILAAEGGGELLTDLDAAGDLARPTAWLMGNEAWGLPEEHASLADRKVGVPMWGRAESLNLSTAAAVCLYASASAQKRER